VPPLNSASEQTPPLTRREMRERERLAQQGANIQPPAVMPSAEDSHTPVLADLFTPSSSATQQPEPRPATVEIAVALPSRRSLRAQVAADAVASVPAIPAAPRELEVVTVPVSTSAKSSKVARSTRALKRAKVSTAPRSRKGRGAEEVKSKRVRVSHRALATSGASQSRGRRKRLGSQVLSLVAMLFAFPIFVGVSVPSNVFLNADSATIAAGENETDVAALSANVRSNQSLAVSDDVKSEVAAHDNIKVISYAEVLALKYAGISYEYNATTGAVRWPFPYSVPITDGYGDRIGGFHKGTDFAAPSGTPIYAIADGTVELIQSDWSGYGYHAIISHTVNGQQVKSLSAHMVTDSSPIVVGQEIKAGDFIGLVGETGIAYGAHLHFEIHLDDVPVDPFAWLTANAVN